MDKPKKLSTVFMVGTIITYGALAFVGMLEFSSSLLLCGTAFVFSGVVEGKVYWEKILAALESLNKDHLQRSILRNKLQDYINNVTLVNSNQFLKEYRRVVERIFDLHELEHELSEKGEHSDEVHHELEALDATLQEMEDFLLKWVKKSNTLKKPRTTSLMEKDALAFVQGKFVDIETVTLQKRAWLSVGAVLATGAGIGSYFATLGAFQIGLALLNIALVGIPGGIVFAVLIYGAIGYALSLYQSIYEVVKKYGLKKLKDTIYDFFLKATWTKRIAMLLVIALTTFAMIATAGTWLKLVKGGALLVPLIEKVASVINWVAIAVMAIPTLIYSLVNSCETFNIIAETFPEKEATLTTISKKITAAWEKFSGKVNKAWNTENFIQFINPFRVVAAVLEIFIFCAHLASMAIGSDQFPEKISSTVAGILVEGAEDAPAWFDCEQGHDHAAHPPALKQLKLENLDDKRHNHSHVFSNILLFFPRVAGVLWDLALSTFWFYCVTQPYQKYAPPVAPAKPIAAPTWKNTKEKFYGKHAERQTTAFNPSDAWIAQKLMEESQQFQQQRSKTSTDKVLKEKLKLITQLKGELARSQGPAQVATSRPKDIVADFAARHKKQFATPRGFNFFQPITKTTAFVESMVATATKLSAPAA